MFGKKKWLRLSPGKDLIKSLTNQNYHDAVEDGIESKCSDVNSCSNLDSPNDLESNNGMNSPRAATNKNSSSNDVRQCC